MFKSFKYQIYPTASQEVLLQKHFGCVRWVYNYGLDLKISHYQTTGQTLSRFDIQSTLPKLKKEEATSWLLEVNAQSLQASVECLDRAFTNFFKHKYSFPKFKKKHSAYSSFQVPQDFKIDFKKNRIHIPKFKGGIKAKFSRQFEGIVRRVTVSQTPTGKYFASVLVDTPDSIPTKKPICENQAVGIDLGIKTFATLSDGSVIENPKYLKKSMRKLKKLSRKHSKKIKGSNNRNKSRIKLARLHEKVANQRLDFLHKTSTSLIRKYDTICLETLRPANMVKNHKLAQSIQDASWGRFNELLEYKAEWYGKNILRIGQFEPSSKLCTCGVINKQLSLSQRTWTCKSCGSTHDRDLLASNNILRMALHPQNKIPQGMRESTLGSYDLQ